MPYKYTWSAKDQFGYKVIKEVEAQSAREAQASLLAAGYSDLELKEDEIMTIVQAGFPEKVKAFGEEIQIAAEQRVQSSENPPASTWGIVKQHLNQGKFLFLVLIVFSAYQFYRGNLISAILLIVALVLWLCFLIFMGLPLIYYRKLIEAADWNRWPEVLSLVTALKNIGRIGIIKVSATELTRYRAKAFAGMGKMDEALREFAPCEGRPDCPGWMYKLFLAGLYGTAKQYDKAIELNLAAISENPSPIAWSDLANRYARYKRDPTKAREAAAEANKSPIIEASKPFRTRCLGIIAYLEGDYPTAKIELVSSINLVENAKWRPFKDGHLAIARAYLCCVLAKQRDMKNAKKNLELAIKYLVATKEDELLAECRKLIGNN